MITIGYTLFIFAMGFLVNMNSNKEKKAYLIVSSVILILVSGLRSYYIGSGDTFRYALMFEQDITMTYNEIIDNVDRDPFYHIFSLFLSKLLGPNFHYVLLVFATIYVSAFDRLISKESPNLLISFIVLFGMNFFNFSMHGVRQGIAIAFVILAYFPLRDRKLLQFLLLVFMATCFHKSAAIFVIAYPFCRLGLNKKTIFLYIGLIGILLISGNDLIRQFAMEVSVYDERFAGYAVTEKALSYAGLVQFTLFFLLILGNLKSFQAQDRDSSILITLLILAMIFQTFAIFIAEMFRVAMYFSIFLVILVPRLLKTYPPKAKTILTVVLCSLLLFYFYSIPYKLEYDFYWND